MSAMRYQPASPVVGRDHLLPGLCLSPVEANRTHVCDLGSNRKKERLVHHASGGNPEDCIRNLKWAAGALDKHRRQRRKNRSGSAWRCSKRAVLETEQAVVAIY